MYKPGNVTGRALRDALASVHSKVLLTATPLQNSLLELFGLVGFIDDRVFGSLDSFRAQFVQGAGPQSMRSLRARIAPLCKRALRRDVQPFVAYTQRRALVQDFTPSDDERALSTHVAEYLRRPQLQALPTGQRQLISMVLWKLLASSSHAIAGALETMANRLQLALADGSSASDIAEALDEDLHEDFETLDEAADEWGETEDASNIDDSAAARRSAIETELADLRQFAELARNIRDDAKGKALLKGLERAFTELERLGAPRKAIVFTESRRTQAYLLSLLEHTPYGAGIVLFNGTNTDERAQTIYRTWLARHEGTDRISASKTADTRAALVEHFREQDTVMIATEAGAEGINLQFCSLVINYELPCVFGASDEVLGAIGSGVDVERRIADIYRTCRAPGDIQSSFEQLQLDLASEINDAMLKTRQTLLENFDDEVHAKVRVRASEGEAVRGRYERMLMQLTAGELGDAVRVHDDGAFDLLRRPAAALEDVALGRYELPRRSGDAHVYRMNHPLAQWVLTVRLVTMSALGEQEQQLIVAGATNDGRALPEDDAEKLLRLPATMQLAPSTLSASQAVEEDAEARKQLLVRGARERQLRYFDREVSKLDAWADDLKHGIEQRIRDVDREIKEVRRAATLSPTLDEKLAR